MQNFDNENKEGSISLITVYRSIYILKKKFEKYQNEISKIYTKYFVKDKENFTNFRFKIINLSSFKPLLEDISRISQFSIIKLDSTNELFISDYMNEEKIKEKFKFALEQITNYITENLEKYNEIFYNKKIKPVLEINMIENIENDFSDYFPIVEYDKKGQIKYYNDKIKELNKENEGKLQFHEISLQKEYENNKNEKNILYIETLPVILADFIQNNLNYVIINTEYDDKDLNNEIKNLFDSDIVHKLETNNKKLKEQLGEMSNYEYEGKINDLLTQELEIDKQINLYTNIMNDKKKSGHDISYLEEFINKLNKEKENLRIKENEEKKQEELKELKLKEEKMKQIQLRKNKRALTLSMENKMENSLKEIFYFYANQHFAMAHSPTFDEIAFAKVHMDIAEFSKFFKEFEIKIPKEQLVELFKKNTKNKRDMTFDEFKTCLYKIGNVMNNNKKDNIEKRINTLKERIEKNKLQSENEVKMFTNISNIDNKESIENQIKSSEKEINELEKEYNRIKNFNYKDVFFEFQSHLGINDPKIYRNKMKGFLNPYHNISDKKMNMNVDYYLVQKKRKEQGYNINKMKKDLLNYSKEERKNNLFKIYKGKTNLLDIQKEEQEKKMKQQEEEKRKKEELKELEKKRLEEEERKKNVFSFDRIENTGLDELNINEDEKQLNLFESDTDNSDEEILTRFGNKKKEKKIESENTEKNNVDTINNNNTELDKNNKTENETNQNIIFNNFKNEDETENVLITQQNVNKLNKNNIKPLEKSKSIKIKKPQIQISTQNDIELKIKNYRTPSSKIIAKKFIKENKPLNYNPITSIRYTPIQNYNNNIINKSEKGKTLIQSGENIVKSISIMNNNNSINKNGNYVSNSVNTVPSQRNQFMFDNNKNNNINNINLYNSYNNHNKYNSMNAGFNSKVIKNRNSGRAKLIKKTFN